MSHQLETTSNVTWSMGASIPVLVLTLIVLAGVTSGQLENSATEKRIYGTWQVRQNQRYCKQVLFCKYREANCMNVTSEKLWTCREINNEIAELGCVLRFCNGTDEICASTSPGLDYLEIPADTCNAHERCYKMMQLSTPTPTTDNATGTTAVRSTQQSTWGTTGGILRSTAMSSDTSSVSADVVWSTCNTVTSGSQTPTITEVSDITCPRRLDCEAYRCDFINSDCSIETMPANKRCSEIAQNYNNSCVVNDCASVGGKCLESAPIQHYTSGPCYSCPFGKSCYVT